MKIFIKIVEKNKKYDIINPNIKHEQLNLYFYIVGEVRMYGKRSENKERQEKTFTTII